MRQGCWYSPVEHVITQIYQILIKLDKWQILRILRIIFLFYYVTIQTPFLLSIWFYDLSIISHVTVQKMKLSMKDYFSKYDQISRKLRIWSHLLMKSIIKNFVFCVACHQVLWGRSLIKCSITLKCSIVDLFSKKLPVSESFYSNNNLQFSCSAIKSLWRRKRQS